MKESEIDKYLQNIPNEPLEEEYIDLKDLIKRTDYEWEHSGDHGERKEWRVKLLDYDGDYPDHYYFNTEKEARDYYSKATEYQVFLQKKKTDEDVYETVCSKIPSLESSIKIIE